MSLQAPLFDAAGVSKGQFDLPEQVFGVAGSRYVLHEVIVALRRNQRRGTSATKTRGLVSGGGHKPWKQKGTGNARAGSNRSPLWRKGGIIFGPLPRSYRVDVHEAKRNLALVTALSEKAKAGDIAILETLAAAEDAKTGKTAGLLQSAGASKRTLLIIDKRSPELTRVLRNIAWIEIAEAAQVNAWMLMRARKIIFIRSALEALANRFPKG